MLVWIQAGEEVKANSPEFTKKEARTVMNKRFQDTSQKVGAIIEENRCEDFRIKDLIKRFEIQAGLDFGQ